MTDITDQQRRAVAASLREAVADAKNTGRLLDDEVFSILGVGFGDLDGSSDPGDVMRLADAIDRPTCQNVSATGNFVCSECGADTTMGIEVWRYCPVCGAEVVGYE